MRIFEIRVAKIIRDVNELERNATTPAGGFQVSFVFLDPGDGTLIEILHGGPRVPVRLHGTIQGSARRVREAKFRFASWKGSRWPTLPVTAAGVITLVARSRDACNTGML